MELQSYESSLIQNLATLSGCKKKHYECSKEIQEIIIQHNDTALFLYTLIEDANNDSFINIVGRAILPIVFLVYTDPGDRLNEKLNSSEKLRERYDAMGCGLSGQLC